MSLNIGEKQIFTLSITKEQLKILDMMALRHEIKRSAMVSRLIMLHADIDVNILEIAERISGNYSEKNIEFQQYLESAKIWLEQKKISQYYIDRIIEEIEKKYETEQTQTPE